MENPTEALGERYFREEAPTPTRHLHFDRARASHSAATATRPPSALRDHRSAPAAANPAGALRIVAVGRAGVGKSEVLNVLHGSTRFPADVSVTPVTRRAAALPSHHGLLVDTPPIPDRSLTDCASHDHDHAVAEIAAALSAHGDLLVLFVVTLEAGRVRVEDLAALQFVVEALEMALGQPLEDRLVLVVNKCDHAVVDAVRRKKEAASDERSPWCAHLAAVLAPFCCVTPVCNVVFVPHDRPDDRPDGRPDARPPARTKSILDGMVHQSRRKCVLTIPPHARQPDLRALDRCFCPLKLAFLCELQAGLQKELAAMASGKTPQKPGRTRFHTRVRSSLGRAFGSTPSATMQAHAVRDVLHDPDARSKAIAHYVRTAFVVTVKVVTLVLLIV